VLDYSPILLKWKAGDGALFQYSVMALMVCIWAWLYQHEKAKAMKLLTPYH
jgi:tryptophan-rich sensory protein